MTIHGEMFGRARWKVHPNEMPEDRAFVMLGSLHNPGVFPLSHGLWVHRSRCGTVNGDNSFPSPSGACYDADEARHERNQ